MAGFLVSARPPDRTARPENALGKILPFIDESVLQLDCRIEH
jgi:hypothetical protein